MSLEPDVSAREKMALLNDAISESEAALSIFLQEKEPEREIRAYTERGVAYRELSRVSRPGEEKEKYIINAESDLRQAINRAQEEELWLAYLDASLGLAWTYYYTGETEKLKCILRNLEKDIQEHFSDHRITARKFPEIREDTVVGAFGQFARLHVLQGVRAMDVFKQSDKQPPYPDLRRAAHHFTIALEYDGLIAEDHLGIRRALKTIHSRLNELSMHELKALYDGVAKAARDLGQDREKCVLWRELENTFGLYEILSQLAR